ncbi:MAG TPA: hypothetical protein V6D06_00205 [Trichocoleus sp.]
MAAGALLSRFWYKVLAVAAIYLSCQYGALRLSGAGWHKYFQPATYKNALDWSAASWEEIHQTWNLVYWDAIHYVDLALNPHCSAWYPLWPLVLKAFAPFTAPDGLRLSFIFTQSLFLLSLPLTLLAFERIIRHRAIAFLCFCLYALGPNAIFHSIGYTESLFGLLSALLLLLLYRLEETKPTPIIRGLLYASLLVTILLLNLNRPILLQTLFAVGVSLTCRFLISRRSPFPQGSLALGQGATLVLGSAIGYSLYGAFCAAQGATFLGPFQRQLEWGRTVAFRPSLLLLPRSLLMDLHGLYLPVALALLTGLLLLAYLRQPKQEQSRGASNAASKELGQSPSPHQIAVPLPRQPWAYLLLVHPLVFSLFIALARWLRPTWLAPQAVEASDANVHSVSRFSVLFCLFFALAHVGINFLANMNALYSTARHTFGSPFALVSLGVILAVVASPRLTKVTWIVAAVGLGMLVQQWFNFSGDHWLG